MYNVNFQTQIVSKYLNGFQPQNILSSVYHS